MDHVGSLLLGLGNGGVFAALAIALVLTYRSSGVVNFATGAIALFAAYTYAGLRAGKLLVLIPGLPKTVDLGGELALAPAMVLALVLAALLGALLYLLVFRPLRDAPPLARAVASLGVLAVLQSLMANRIGVAPVGVDGIFPSTRWKWGEISLLSDRVYLSAAVVALALLLGAVAKWTRFGLVTRAAADSQVGAFVSGLSPDRVALLNWMLGAAVAGAAGILIAPLSPLTPITYTLFVVPALAAAVVGGFQHLLPTVAAGLAIGMLQNEALTLALRNSWLPRSGSPELVPFILIVAALLLTSRAIPERGGPPRQPLGRAPRPRSLLVPTAASAVVGVVALVVTDGMWRAAVIGTFIAGVIGLSLVVVTGFAGQVSVAQLALAGAGAFTLTGLTNSWGVPFPLAPLLAALATAALGVVVGLPALRLRGLTLGVVTLALAYAIERAWFSNTQIVPTEGARVKPPRLFGVDLGVGVGKAFPRIEFGLLCLVVLVTVGWGVARLRMSALGSAMLAVRANERSAAGIGVNVVWVKSVSFALASFIAGLGGSLLAYRRGIVTHDSFTALGGLGLLSTAYLAGITSVFGGVLAGVLASGGIVFFALDKWVELGDWYSVITGIALILTVITNPEGLAVVGHRLAARLARQRPAASVGTTAGAFEQPAPTMSAAALASVGAAATVDGPPVLEVNDLSVRYGGVVAVADAALRVRPGTIIGLIGPNGAGKSSLIDAVTGFTPSTGAVWFDGRRIDGLPAHTRVRRGLGRTFQSLELYDDLSVEENVAAALFGRRGADAADAVSRALDLVGIGDLRDRPAGALSQGERQLVSIARACAADPKVVLLDEPAAGLDTSESRWLADRIRGLGAAGVGVLLVDHDVALVLGVCDHIYVLDFGQIIAEGNPAAIRANRAVADAYLGSVPQSTAAE